VTSDIAQRVFAIHRPAPELMKYYVLASLLLGPLFFIALIPLYFRYHTMHYDFDEEGISMRWGILFRREVTLTYARIQDIHLTSNIVERWLGLARIQIQTASASASAEMTIEGLHEFAMVRDFLYTKMRGVLGAAPPLSAAPDESASDLGAVLREVASELRAIREALSKRS
jgi:membrane protein YdbS with pleckstrin-like domain